MRAYDRTTNAGARVLVLGGGLSGLAAAQRLAVRGVDEIVVVEAGDRTLDDHINALLSEEEIENRWRVPGEDPVLWRPWDSVSSPHYGGATGLRCQLGGRSLYWHGVVLPMDPWALADGSPWPADLMSGNRLYEEVERDLTQWSGRPLDGVRSATEESLLDWFRSIGCPTAQRTPLAVQRFATESGPRWRAYNPLYAGTAHAPAVHDVEAVRIVTGARAVHVALHAGTVEALLEDRATGAVRAVRADAVVLAAGTIENTRLVAQALGDREQVRYTGLSDHVLQGFTVHLPDHPWGAGGGEGACLLALGDGETRSNTFVKLIDAPAGDGVFLDVWEMGEQEPSDLGAVEFPDRSRTPWRTSVRTGLTARDVELITRQQHRLQQLWEATADALGLSGSRLDFGDYATGNRDVDGYLEEAVTTSGTAVGYVNTLGATDHESGSLPYGKILDPTGQVRGAEGVFVVGPATFPRPGAANPSLTTLALARHVADAVASYLDGERPRPRRVTTAVNG